MKATRTGQTVRQAKTKRKNNWEHHWNSGGISYDVKNRRKVNIINKMLNIRKKIKISMYIEYEWRRERFNRLLFIYWTGRWWKMQIWIMHWLFRVLSAQNAKLIYLQK